MKDLWGSASGEAWRAALDAYPSVVAAQSNARLPELDAWYREELPAAIAKRASPFVTLEELAKVTEWKMHRGVWRARNLALVRGNDPQDVEAASRKGLDLVPDPKGPIREMARLAGVGPATASGVAAAAAPDVYPFFDELVSKQVPGLGPVAFTLRYYIDYASALRDRSARLGEGWMPADVERALWSNSGGKAAIGA